MSYIGNNRIVTLESIKFSSFLHKFKQTHSSQHLNFPKDHELFVEKTDKIHQFEVGFDLIQESSEFKAKKDIFSIAFSDVHDRQSEPELMCINREDYSAREFSFEPANEYELLEPRNVYHQLRTSSIDQCAAETILFRHNGLIEHGKGLEESEQEHAISKHFELFNLMTLNKPFLTRPNPDSILYDEDKFKYARLLKKLSRSQVVDFTDKKTVRNLRKFDEFCRKYQLIGHHDESFLRPLFEMRLQTDILEDEEQIKKKLKEKEKANTQYVTKLSQIAYKQLEKKLENLNKSSFYYIKSNMEELYCLVQDEKQRKIVDDDFEEIDNLRTKIARSIYEAVETYEKYFANHGKKIFLRNSKLSLNQLENEQKYEKDQDYAWNIWGEVISCYYSFITDLKRFFTLKLSYGREGERRCFVDTLLGHPSSFLISKKALKSVHWDLIETLKTTYQEYNEKWRTLPTPNNTSGFDFAAISANLCVSLQAENRMEKKKFFMLVPVFDHASDQKTSNVKIINQDSEEMQLDTIFRKVIDKLPNKITVIQEELEFQKLKITAINEIGIDFYFSKSYKKIFNYIESTLSKSMFLKIEEVLKNNIAGNLSTEPISKNFSLYYTVKNKADEPESKMFEEQIFLKAPDTDIHQTDTNPQTHNSPENTKDNKAKYRIVSWDDDEERVNKSVKNASNNYDQREISFFDYSFLERLVTEGTTPNPYFMARTYLISKTKRTSLNLTEEDFAGVINKIDDLKTKMNNSNY